MDGTKPSHYRPVRKAPARLPANQRFSRSAATIKPNEFTGLITYSPTDLAPAPPSGVPDNLLVASTQAAEIIVHAPLPPNADYTDTVQLRLGEPPVDVGTPIVVDAFINAGANTMDIPLSAADRALQPEGRVKINYVIQFLSGNSSYESGPDAQYYVTDYTKPSSTSFLGDLEFSQEVEMNGVTEASLVEENGNFFLPAEVPSYEGLAPGDIITGIVSGMDEVVDAITVGTGAIQLRFKRDFIVAQGDGQLTFAYKVRDRAGNESDPSKAVTLQVLLSGSIPDLLAPTIPAFEGDADPKLVDEADARRDGGVIVSIPANPGILAGDSVIVLWGSAEIGETIVASPPPADPLPVAEVGVPYIAVSESWNAASAGSDTPQNLDVSYRIERGGIVAGTALSPTSITVNLYQAGGLDPDPETPAHENLGKARLVSASGQDNAIPPEDSALDATIFIPFELIDPPATPAFIVGDIVTLTYGGTELTPVAIDPVPATEVEVIVTGAIISAEGSGDKALSYTVTRALASGGPNISIAPAETVVVHGSDELPGGGLGLVPVEVPEAGTPPARLLIGKQQAKDGTDFIIPPYANQAIGDTITLSMTVFRSFYGTPGHPADVPSTDLRDKVFNDIHPTSSSAPTIVHITEYDLMRYDYPTQALHAHVEYTVEGAATPGRPVTSAIQLLDLDPRGD